MQADDAYRWLTEGSSRTVCDAFDAHVCASALALALAESAAEGKTLSSAVGLDGVELAALGAEMFPHGSALLSSCETGNGPGTGAVIERAPDEACLLDLLQRCATRRSPLELRLAAIIARRAQRPNHLWQDLGLRTRDELTRLMERHFAPLARKNARNMKWKKFLYRVICQDSSYSLCTAPSCAECDDFEICFGDEGGESLLARFRRDGEATEAREQAG
jgi:nitrogen fixation protein NifQ